MWQVVQQVLAQAWQQFSSQSLALLPNVLASLLFLAIGVVLGVAAGRIAKFLLRRSAVERRRTYGGTAFDQVAKQIEDGKAFLESFRESVKR